LNELSGEKYDDERKERPETEPQHSFELLQRRLRAILACVVANSREMRHCITLTKKKMLQLPKKKEK